MNDVAGLGHNQPPPDPLARADELIANCDRWTSERPEITDSEMAGLAQDYLRQLRLNRDALDAASKAERQPHDLAIAAVRATYRSPLEKIGIAMQRITTLLKPWLQREEDRIAAEAAARRRAADDAAAMAAAAFNAAESAGTVEAEQIARDAERARLAAEKLAKRAPPKAHVRGDLSPRAMFMRITHYAVVTDEARALETYAAAPTVRAAALQEATRLATKLAKETKGDASRCPAGFEFRREETPT